MKEKILMFGEGNFLRAFAAVVVQRLNDNAGFEGSIVALQGMENGLSELINSQNGRYNVIERGVEKGQIVDRAELIKSISRCINPYTEYALYIKQAENPDLKAIISNTTEFGICYNADEKKDKMVHVNFPAKLTDFLYKRFCHFCGAPKSGLIILPCELIEDNGNKLKQIVLRYSKEWNLGASFTDWINTANIFTNTLVDRIVSGYPTEEVSEIEKKLGFDDKLIDVCEPFLLWVIESDVDIESVIPFNKSGLNIIVTKDMTPYRNRKVRILNGAHTMSVLAGNLCGFKTVEQLVKDDVFYAYFKKGIFLEIIPSMMGEKLSEYAEDVLERFRNPFLKHKLLSISLNSVSKFKTRIVPSIKDYVSKFGYSPKILSFSLAALIVFYQIGLKSYVNDDKEIISLFEGIFLGDKIVENTLKNKAFWGEDLSKLPGLQNAVKKYYDNICNNGINNAIVEVVK